MFKLFFKNIYSSMVATILTYIAAGIVTSFAWAILDSFLAQFLSSTIRTIVFEIVMAVLSIIGAFFYFLLRDEDKTYHDCNGSPHIAQVIASLVIQFVLIGLSALTICVFTLDMFSVIIPENDIYSLLAIAFPSIFATQLVYLILGIFHYNGNDITCPKCKHCFCVGSSYLGSEQWDEYRYKDTTSNESIGSIEIGDSSIDVRADVTRRKYKQMHHTDTKYACKCQHCGHKYNHKRYHVSIKDL